MRRAVLLSDIISPPCITTVVYTKRDVTFEILQEAEGVWEGPDI